MLAPAFYPVGCCYLSLRRAFLELGGYDDLFAPFLWEYVDLGYRAWRRGLRILHDPEAVCHHEGSTTLKERHSPEARERLSFRNRVLFHLKNVRDAGRRAEVFGALAAYALFETLESRRLGLADAVARAPGASGDADDGLDDAAILERIAP